MGFAIREKGSVAEAVTCMVLIKFAVSYDSRHPVETTKV
jgi:hypothetical protein